mmetsp:Transcript_8670/g.38579  ORF Transcript_8670/g.38579 Transcript_8670/m.38579 type:complete len:523 (-) Transcript_8670:3325-4893(-)
MVESSHLYLSPKRSARRSIDEELDVPPTPVKSPGRGLLMDWSDDEEDDTLTQNLMNGGQLRRKHLPPRFPATILSPGPSTPPADRFESARAKNRFRMSSSPEEHREASRFGSPSNEQRRVSTPMGRLQGKRRLESSSRNESIREILRSPFRHTPPPPPNFNPFSPEGRKHARHESLSPRRVDPTLTAAATRASNALTRFANSSLCETTIGSSFTDDDGELSSLLKPSRYKDDFEEIAEIGKGSFGRVFKCQMRLDGLMYAVKSTKRKIRGRGQLQDVLREVYALAAMSTNPYVVRYYSAWIEDDYLYIQTELVEGGSLSKRIFSENHSFGTEEVKDLLRQLASGLQNFHERRLVHLDLKPENLYLTREGIYKIGDLGLTTLIDHIESPDDLVEGDGRYLAREVMEGTCGDLRKADMFSLGLSAYELCSGRQLQSNGEEWREIRRCNLKPIEGLDPNLFNLIKRLVDPDPDRRPTAAELMLDPILYRPGDEFLLKELDHERCRRQAAEERVRTLEAELKALKP